MNKKMLFVFNPKAGKGKIKTNLLEIVDIFNKGGYEVTIYSTQKPRDAYEKAKEYEDKVDLIVCSGGDGTTRRSSHRNHGEKKLRSHRIHSGRNAPTILQIVFLCRRA